jgi:hypothetical protein
MGVERITIRSMVGGAANVEDEHSDLFRSIELGIFLKIWPFIRVPKQGGVIALFL